MSDEYDGVYVNTLPENKNMAKIYNKDISENPYYETATNLECKQGSREKADAVDLENTEVVTASKNIYYKV